MTEQQRGATPTERKAAFQSQLTEEISAYSADVRYKGISGSIRNISVQAAVEALLTPRNELFEKIK